MITDFYISLLQKNNSLTLKKSDKDTHAIATISNTYNHKLSKRLFGSIPTSNNGPSNNNLLN